MKKVKYKLFSLWLVLLSSILHVYGENSFYYSGSKKYSLSVIPTKRAILRKPSQNSSEYVERVGARIEIIDIDAASIIKEMATRVYELENENKSLPVFLINGETEVILLPEIVIKTKHAPLEVANLYHKFGLTLVKETKACSIYAVPTGSDIIDIANTLYETGMFDYVYPNFFCSAESFAYIPNDEYFQYQVTCHNIGQTFNDGHTGTIDADINAPEAWDITKGSPNIVIAVFDEGVSSNHPDLPNSRQVRLNGSNFGSGNPNDPSPTGDSNHGNACAGVIAATMDNNEGIAGIAPHCKIMPLRWDATSTADDMANAIYFAIENGANVISCSWGYKNSGSSPNLHPSITAAIDSAIQQGVNVVFATGNTASHVDDINGSVLFPANANVANLITVGASDRYDRQANYSPTSSLVDFVAPSHRAYSNQIYGETFEMWSIDIPGNNGYNPTPETMADYMTPLGSTLPSSGTNYLAYTGRFGGTSHSCPVIAGVVALISSVNPYLTPLEVFEILKKTSNKVGDYTYINGKCDQMGYGRVDAYAAVKEAQSRYIVGPNYVCDTTMYCLIHPSASDETVTWSVHNGQWTYPHYSIVGANNHDTVYIRCERMHIGPTDPTHPDYLTAGGFPLDTIQSLSATITNGTTSSTYSKIFRNPSGEIPTISASNSSSNWLSGTTRTFTISNCTSTPDAALSWEIKKITMHLDAPDDTVITTTTGRSVTYTASTPLRSLCRVYVTATNTQMECEPQSVTNAYVVTRKILLLGNVESGQLNVSIYEEDDKRSTSLTLADICAEDGYLLELQHNIYGRMASQNVQSAKERINSSQLPSGIYVLLLKDARGEVVAQTKVIIH